MIKVKIKQGYKFKDLIRNKPLEVHISISNIVIISAALILIALTGKIGATIAFFALAFLVVIYLLPDDF